MRSEDEIKEMLDRILRFREKTYDELKDVVRQTEGKIVQIDDESTLCMIAMRLAVLEAEIHMLEWALGKR